MSYHEGSNWQAKKEDAGKPLYENKPSGPPSPVGEAGKGILPHISGNILTRDGLSEEWLNLWSEVEHWYGDIKKKETGHQFLLRMQSEYPLASSPNPSRAGDTKDDFVKGYACALVCIIQGHGISTEVEDAYKAGLPTPVSELKGRIDEFDYSILKKHFK